MNVFLNTKRSEYLEYSRNDAEGNILLGEGCCKYYKVAARIPTMILSTVDAMMYPVEKSASIF